MIYNKHWALIGLLMMLPLSSRALADEARKAPLKEGRFWVYRNSSVGLFFLPYAFMPEQASKMIEMHVDDTNNPHRQPEKPTPPQTTKPAASADKQEQESDKEEDTCISVKIKWAAPNWCGVAFISGPDSPPWWGDDDRGRHFDLRDLPKKRLIFWARSDTKATIQIKIGILGAKPFGDSMKMPVESKWLTLKTAWTQYILDLSKVKPEWLSAICNGFTFIVSQTQQEDPYAKMTAFFLDDIYFE